MQPPETARKAAELSEWKNGDTLYALATAYAEAGKFADAVRWQEKAMEIPDFMKGDAEGTRPACALSARPALSSA